MQAKRVELVEISKWNAHFPFSLPFKKSCFPEKISVRGDKTNLSIYIPSEISGFLGKW